MSDAKVGFAAKYFQPCVARSDTEIELNVSDYGVIIDT